jgi:hypothetical protein
VVTKVSFTVLNNGGNQNRFYSSLIEVVTKICFTVLNRGGH